MNEQPVTTSKTLKRPLAKLKTWQGSRMFGPAEIAAVSVSCVILLLVLFSYVYFLVPARSQRAAMERDRIRLKDNLVKFKEVG